MTSPKVNTVYKLEKKIRQHELDIEEISASLKRASIRIIGIEEGSEAETKGINHLFREVILKNFPNIEREVDTQAQETYRTPNRQDQRRGSPRHIIIKLTNVEAKETILTFFFAVPGIEPRGILPPC